MAAIATWPHEEFGRLRKKPNWATRPAQNPIHVATTANGAAKSEWSGAGRTYVQTRFARSPVTRPGIGPARTPTRIVPSESR